jgi:small subunit ribosomal protein S18
MKPRQTKRIRPVARNCHFCDNKMEPDYKDVTLLGRYLTERGKLLGRNRTGICSKHQRAMENAVKLARHVAFLPFLVRA